MRPSKVTASTAIAALRQRRPSSRPRCDASAPLACQAPVPGVRQPHPGPRAGATLAFSVAAFAPLLPRLPRPRTRAPPMSLHESNGLSRATPLKRKSPLLVDPGNLRVFASHGEHIRFERPKQPPKSRVGQRELQRRFNVRLKGEASCRNCGAAGHLHLHHAIPRSVCKEVRLDLRNGIPLCPSCHARWHQRTLVIYRDVFTSEEWEFLCSVELLGQRTSAWLDDHYPAREQAAA